SSAISAGGSSSLIAAIASSNSSGVLGSMLLKRSSISRAASQNDSELALDSSSSPQAARASARAGTARPASSRREVEVGRVVCIDRSLRRWIGVSRAPDHAAGHGVMGAFPRWGAPRMGWAARPGGPAGARYSAPPAGGGGGGAGSPARGAGGLPWRSAPVAGGVPLDVGGEFVGEDHLAPQPVLVG